MTGVPLLWTRRIVAADPTAAWDLLTDPERWGRWGPTVRRGELDPPGRFEAGATGRVVTAVGIPLPFVLTDVDPGSRWAWRVAGVPATVHTVEPVDRGCRIGIGVPAPAAAYLPVCALGLRRIEAILLGG